MVYEGDAFPEWQGQLFFCAFNTGNIGGGKTSAPIAMNTAGSFPYHCSIHPTMTGTLVVVVP